MEDKIEIALEYYLVKRKEILNAINTNTCLSAEDIIHYGEEMAILEHKITALEVAKES